MTTSCVYLYNECLENDSGPKLAFSLDLADKIDSRIKSALSIEYYLVILSEKGTIYMFGFSDESGERQLIEIDKVSESNFFFANVSCFTLYKDETNLFAAVTESSSNENQPATTTLSTSVNMDHDTSLMETIEPTVSFHDPMNVDDEEELLYGKAAESADSINKLLTNTANDVKPIAQTQTPQPSEASVQPVLIESAPIKKTTTYWLVTVNFDGVLNLIWLENQKFELIYSIPRFNQAPKTIIPLYNYKHVALEFQESVSASLARVNSMIETTNQVVVSEILLISVGFERNRPMLIVKMDEDLIIYEAFLSASNRKGSISF